MTSPMFNLPGRLVLGSHCYYENLPQLLSEIRSHASEEDIGRGMKRLCTPPELCPPELPGTGFPGGSRTGPPVRGGYLRR